MNKKIVTIGGGTGSFTLLTGLKHLGNIDLCAIVAMTDDGGSTGVLRDELGVLPPGDVRQCLIALSNEDKIMRELMNYRFENGGLEGHSFGNILLAGLEKVTGSFVQGLEVASNILKIKGRVVPITTEKANLSIRLNDDTVLESEDQINNYDIETVGVKDIFIKDASVNNHAKEAIVDADYIFIGPGNHFCSIIPNLAVSGVKESFLNTKAKIVYIGNLTNKKGHTSKYKLSDYVNDIEKYLGRKLDIILFNGEKPTEEQIYTYKIQEGENVIVENDMKNDTRLFVANLLNKNIHMNNKKDSIAHLRAFIRHDSEKLVNIISSNII